VPGEFRFRADLYEGTAADYDAYRPPYPTALIDDLRARSGITDHARVLDLACGTGQVAFALAPFVAAVVAVDQEAGTVEFARRKAERLGVANIDWVTASAETAPLDGQFQLVTLGNAFHRVERDVVAGRVVPHLVDGGCVAVLGGGMPWPGDASWQQAIEAVTTRWQTELGSWDRIPSGWQDAMDRDPHARVLERAGLVYEGKFEFSVAYRWSVESLAGFVYSTSLLSRAVLGTRIDDFERDLSRALLDARPDGDFEHELSFGYELARRREQNGSRRTQSSLSSGSSSTTRSGWPSPNPRPRVAPSASRRSTSEA
jgi:SAM-dependent methyltransferase